MPNSNRQKGDYLERQTRAALEAHGWLVVRAAGSLGVADLVALRWANTPLLVSCKVGGKIGPAERTALIDAARNSGSRPLMATREIRGHVDIYAVKVEPEMVRVDRLKVPARPKYGSQDNEP